MRLDMRMYVICYVPLPDREVLCVSESIMMIIDECSEVLLSSLNDGEHVFATYVYVYVHLY